MKVLHIDSSILGEGSASRALTREIVARVKSAHRDAEVTYLDLAAQELPHLSHRSLARSDETEAARNAAALEQFLAADLLVIGAPIYNFSIPTQLKAWIDRITVAGKTFRYTATGPVGLAGGKQVIIVSSRGSQFEGSTMAALDHQESYLKTVFGFLGITDIHVLRAEGIGLDPEAKQSAIEAAHATVDALVARVTAEARRVVQEAPPAKAA